LSVFCDKLSSEVVSVLEKMSFRSIVRDVRDGFGSLSRRSFEVRLPGHQRGKSRSSVHELHDQPPVIQNSPWASLPPELLRDVIKRLEATESTWPGRKHVVACAAVCKSWREMCKEIVNSLEYCGKITFPVSLKQVRYRSSILCLKDVKKQVVNEFQLRLNRSGVSNFEP